MKKTIVVQVLGPKNPCNNCIATQKNIESAIMRVVFPDVTFEVKHEDITSKEIIEKFGVLKSPAVVAGDLVLFQGIIPPVDKAAKILADIVVMNVERDPCKSTSTKGCGCGCK